MALNTVFIGFLFFSSCIMKPTGRQILTLTTMNKQQMLNALRDAHDTSSVSGNGKLAVKAFYVAGKAIGYAVIESGVLTSVSLF